MIKGLKPWKMSNTEDMESYMLPSLRTEPDEIIVHIGTNDVHNKMW